MKKDEENKGLFLEIFILAVGFTAVIIFSSVPFGKKALDEPVVEPAKESTITPTEPAKVPSGNTSTKPSTNTKSNTTIKPSTNTKSNTNTNTNRKPVEKEIGDIDDGTSNNVPSKTNKVIPSITTRTTKPTTKPITTSKSGTPTVGNNGTNQTTKITTTKATTKATTKPVTTEKTVRGEEVAQSKDNTTQTRNNYVGRKKAVVVLNDPDASESDDEEEN